MYTDILALELLSSHELIVLSIDALITFASISSVLSFSGGNSCKWQWSEIDFFYNFSQEAGFYAMA